MEKGLDVIAICISSGALIFSLLQFVFSTIRQKREATLNAYIQLQEEVFSQLNIMKKPYAKIRYESDEWQKITCYLAKIEVFCVGINTGIFSERVLNRVGGAYFIRQFNELKVIIDKKRKKNISKGNHYNEFEKTVEKLKKLRKM